MDSPWPMPESESVAWPPLPPAPLPPECAAVLHEGKDSVEPIAEEGDYGQ
jgi:hypothetical protein